jgi:HK97 family phage major capsid protein
MTAPTLAAPTTPAEWEEYVNGFDTPEAFKAAFADDSDKGFKAKLAAYQGATNKTMEDLKRQVTESATASMLELLKRGEAGDDVATRKNALSLVEAAKSRGSKLGTAYNKAAAGAPADGVFDNQGEFVQAILARQSNSATDAQLELIRQHGDRFKNYSERNPSDGGFLVPEEFRADILEVALEAAIVRPRATVVPMSGLKLKYPAIDMSTEVGEVFGGIIMYWLDEGQTIPDTSAAFAAIQLELNKLGGLASLPNELVRDAKALNVWLNANLPKALAHFEDIGYLKGNGVKKPLGALHADNPALIVVGDETGQSTASITWVNVLSMFARMLPESLDNAEWYITPDAIPEIFTMALPVGTGGSAVMMAEGGGTGALPMTMLGLPINWTRKAPATMGTQGDISLADLSTYIIGDGQEMRFDTSQHSSFRSDKTDLRVITRVDGQPGVLNPLTPENNGPTLSPYVQLETRTLD